MPHQSKWLLVSQMLLVVSLLLTFERSIQAQTDPTPTPSPSVSPCPTPEPDLVAIDVIRVARIEAIALSNERNRATSAKIKEVKIIRRDGSEEPATINAQLYEGDSVETGNESFVSVLFAFKRNDADQVILYPNTRITIGTAWNWWGPILNRVRGYFKSGTSDLTGASRTTEYLLIVCDDKHRNRLCKDKDPGDRSERMILTALDDAVDVLPYDISVDSPYSDPSGNRFFTIKRRQANLFARILQVMLFRKPKGRYYKISPPGDMPWLRFSPPEIKLKKGQSAKVMPSIDNPDDVAPKRYSGDLKIECSDPDCDRYKLDVIFSGTRQTTLPIVVAVRNKENVDQGQQLTATRGADKAAVASVDKSEARKLVAETSDIILRLQAPELVEHVMPHYSINEERQRVFKEARIAALVDNSADAYTRLGNVNLDWGRGEKALSAFDKSASFHANLAEAYRLIGDLERAQKEITTALEDRQERYLSRSSNTQGNIYLDRAKSTISDYESVPAQYYCYRAQVLAKAREYLYRASDMYLRASRASVDELEMKPENRAIPLTNLGDVYLLQSQLLREEQASPDKMRLIEEALRTYTDAVKANPGYAYAAIGEGYAYLRIAMLQGYQNRGLSESARRSFNKAISINPNLKTAYVGRSIANQYLEDLEAAQKDIQSVIELDPKVIPTVRVPDVMKKRSSEAERLIMDAGLFPQLSGNGPIVVDQTPWAGKDIPVGSVVKLRLGSP
jgi:tetratricopeptide (TPR) repeat protein